MFHNVHQQCSDAYSGTVTGGGGSWRNPIILNNKKSKDTAARVIFTCYNSIRPITCPKHSLHDKVTSKRLLMYKILKGEDITI